VFEPVNQISRARNAGAAATQARYLIFLDADTLADAPVLRAALTALDSGLICGGGSRVGTTDKLTTFWANRALGLWNFMARMHKLAAGSFVYCLREAWVDTGGFSHQVYAGEELFFSRALRRWGRKRGLRFKVLTEAVDTSMRKLAWYKPHTVLWVFLRFLLFPWMLRSKKRCHIWYGMLNFEYRISNAEVNNYNSELL
jgi:glycosyltransferase involved in cell wall biosynthesis